MKEVFPQTRQTTGELAVSPEATGQGKLHQCDSLQRFLHHFLATYTGTAPFFEQIVLQVAPFLDKENQAYLEEFISEGQEIIIEAITVVQKLLQEQEPLPSMEIQQSDHIRALMETSPFPFSPMLSSEDQTHFSECLILLGEWHQDLLAFLKDQK